MNQFCIHPLVNTQWKQAKNKCQWFVTTEIHASKESINLGTLYGRIIHVLPCFQPVQQQVQCFKCFEWPRLDLRPTNLIADCSTYTIYQRSLSYVWVEQDQQKGHSTCLWLLPSVKGFIPTIIKTFESDGKRFICIFLKTWFELHLWTVSTCTC